LKEGRTEGMKKRRKEEERIKEGKEVWKVNNKV